MATKDYYSVLGLAKTATPKDIKKSYRDLALKFHPDRVEASERDAAQKKFVAIGEAYEVLSDPEKRKQYDEELSNPFASAGGGGHPGFSAGGGGGGGGGGGPRTSFHSSGVNPNDIFRQFFGTSDPFAAAGSSNGGFDGMEGIFMNMGGAPMGGGGGRGIGGGSPFAQQGGRGGGMQKGKEVNYILNVSLKEVYTGVSKKMRITRKVLDQSGRTAQVAVDKEITITPGWKDGTKITFECEGDELPGVIPGDIVFTLHSRPSDGFTRDGDDLLYTCAVPFSHAFTGVNTTIQSLDNRAIRVTAPAVEGSLHTVVTIPGEGMPNKKKRVRGDLKVTIAFTMPKLTSAERGEIAKVLQKAERR